MRGSTPPIAPFRKKPNLNGLTGRWAIQWGTPGSITNAQAMLSGSGKKFTGTVTLRHKMELQRWRRKDCDGQSHVEATQHFSVIGNVDEAKVRVTYSHDKYTDCSCSETVCKATAAVVDMPGGTFYMNLDGTVLMKQGVLMSKLP